MCHSLVPQLGMLFRDSLVGSSPLASTLPPLARPVPDPRPPRVYLTLTRLFSGLTKAVNKTAPRLTEQLGVCAVLFCCTFVLCACTTVSPWRSEGYLQEWVPTVHNVAARDSNSGPQAWRQTPSLAEPSCSPSALCFKTGALTGQLRASGSSYLFLCLYLLSDGIKGCSGPSVKLCG